MAYSGKQSLKISAQYGFVGRKLTGLTPNTDYIISFYAYLTHTKDASAAGLGGLMVTDTATSAAIKVDGTVKERTADHSGVIFRDSTLHTEIIDKWEKISIAFNSGKNEEVIFWMSPKGTSAVAYIDNLAITRTAEFEVESSIYGTTNIEGTNKVGLNEKVTVTATPLEGNTFDGWYVGDELVSTDAAYSFIAGEYIVLTPKFSGTTYEHFGANGKDGTFETGTLEDWNLTFIDPNYDCGWCNAVISTEAAYKGNNSLKLSARHRNTIIPLTGLDKNTNYTLSFMFRIDEIEAPTGNVAGAAMKRAQLNAGVATTDITHIEESTEALAKTGAIYSTASWQKAELSFNTGDNTELNLVVRFAREIDGPMYLDNLTLMHKDTVAPEIVPGDIDGDGEVALDDVNELSRYLAGWTDVNVNEEALDVNGDGAVNLKDLVLLAQFEAGWDVTLP